MERTHLLTNKRDMINDKVKSVVSLLETKYIIVIKHLVETSYVTNCDKFIFGQKRRLCARDNE
uniref:Uncharacterized protein n=1 Tax=viral metagenome TaxID=1070528 RepID=A0A6C0CC80_9ZZZZ